MYAGGNGKCGRGEGGYVSEEDVETTEGEDLLADLLEVVG